MFYNCSSFNQSVTIPDSVTNCYRMFAKCNSLDRPVSVGADVTNCESMFAGCHNFNQPVAIPASAKGCASMFAGCHNFNQNLYIPDGSNFFYILEYCNMYQSTISIPTNMEKPAYLSKFGVGLNLGSNTVGATVVIRDVGETYRIENMYNSQNNQYYIGWNKL